MRSIALLLLALSVVGCTEGERASADVPVPRRAGYPRIEIPDATYRDIDVAGVSLSLNSVIDSVVSDKEGWITATYPRSLATLYVTVTPIDPSTAAAAIDNRIERLSMNTGGAPTVITEIDNDNGLDTKLLVTPHATMTPVQFIATDHKKLLVSGTAVVPCAATAPGDSLAPVIAMLERDATHLLSSIR